MAVVLAAYAGASPASREPTSTPTSAAGTVQRPRDIAAPTATPSTMDSGASVAPPSA